MRVIGLISGTSMDGIDVAVADFGLRGEEIECRPVATGLVPYPARLRADLEMALPPASTSVETVCRLDTEVGQAFAAAASAVASELSPPADLVASHGQTIFHWVDGGRALGTLQIGQPAWIAAATGLPVVADLRAADIAAGGHGAPLAALFDVLLLAGHPAKPELVRGSLNLGGIANLTVVGGGRAPLAYDTGPANALIDAAVRHLSGGERSFDAQGTMASQGRVVEPLLDVLLAEPYYRQPPPKTTGKELFHLPYLQSALERCHPVSPEDLVATLTRLSARTVADACREHGVMELVVAGGGVRNPVLWRMLAEELPEVVINPIDLLGVPADAKEACFIALIGFLAVHGVAGNLPAATGASRAVPLGCLVPGGRPLLLPTPATVIPRRLVITGSRS